jgi:two-component system sensor histidine kinase PhoQ
VTNLAMRSLNARVALSAGLVLAIFVALSAFALERAFRDSARSARQDRLLAQVYLLMAAAEVDAQGRLTLSGGPPEPRLDLPGSGLYASIVDASGTPVWRSRSTLALDLPVPRTLEPGVQRFEEIAAANGARLLAQRFGVSWTTGGASYPFTFSVMEDIEPFEQQLSVYRRSLWGWLGAMAVLLLAVLWLTLRWGLRPLRQVANELGQLEQGHQQQLTGDYPTELRGLTDNLNALLTRERAQLQRYRDALADLAHSLKTPLALMRGSLHGSVQQPTSRMLEDQIERMDRIVGYHLQRASTTGLRALAAPHPLRALAERLTSALSRVHADKRIEVSVDIGPGMTTRIDEGDLTELLGNVLDNAFKWGTRRVRVAAARNAAGALVVEVEDDGPGIAPADAQQVLERGMRADESVPGHGIGLAVVRDILSAYDGRIEIGRSGLGGARVTLTLPERLRAGV